MTWSLRWSGRAADYHPGGMTTLGSPGRVAHAAREAIWEAVQAIADQNGATYAQINANGAEDPKEPGHGGFNLSIIFGTDEILEPPTSGGSVVTPTDTGPADPHLSAP